ncbi:hypothetical protein EVAR_41309_1 [Eumeta japonica]|uniref:Uncharacterized protein n=1 Tax=Eumeta variegata TaxID=151549 RepID=A0A4C1X100_EUMVA|nr:hypothetical protein EVAR_41309_1 [Eumeta japonica]
MGRLTFRLSDERFYRQVSVLQTSIPLPASAVAARRAPPDKRPLPATPTHAAAGSRFYFSSGPRSRLCSQFGINLDPTPVLKCEHEPASDFDPDSIPRPAFTSITYSHSDETRHIDRLLRLQ